MKNFIAGGFVAGMLSVCSAAVNIESRTVEITGLDAYTLRLDVLSPRSVRVRRLPKKKDARPSLVIIESAWDTDQPVSIEKKDGAVEIRSDYLFTSVDTASGKVTFFRPDGSLILKEAEIRIRPDQKEGLQSEVRWDCAEGESYYGLGQLQLGILDLRGKRVELKQDNTKAVSPYISSSGGYSVFWDHYSHSVFDAQTDGAIGFGAEVADSAEYVFCVGADFDTRIAEYRKMTGAAPLFPKWAYGYQQSRERYKTQQEVIDIVGEFRKRKFPLDLIIQDWKYWGDDAGYWSGMRFDPTRYPDPSGLTKAVHDLDARIMLVVWPFPGERSEVKADLEAGGGLIGRASGFLKKTFLYDAYRPAARAIYLEHAKRTMIDHDFDAWWADGCEPENMFSGPTALGPLELVRNAFVLEHTHGIYDLQRKTMPQKRVYILARSGFAGVQRYGVATWSGDIDASWEVLAKQVTAGLGFSMSGLPYWTMDIGAFTTKLYPEGNQDPAYKELYTRWFQFGAFCPLFRSHGTDTPREPWMFGDPGTIYYDTLLKFARLRYRLQPYIYSLAGMVTHENYTMMRAMPMDFDDEALEGCTDQYMFGPAFMVAPILSAQRPDDDRGTRRLVRLPKEASWYNFWDGSCIDGGAGLEVATPIDQMPLYVRAGSIVPMGPIMEFTDQIINPPIELRIYTGEDGNFVLYQDEGDGYGYETGAFSRIPMSWDNADGILTIGEREGKFEGMPEKITFLAVKVRPEKGIGMKETDSPDKVITYSGKAIQVQLKKK